MVLVELKGLCYQYRTSIYAVDRVNGTVYGKFSVGYRIIHEKATVIPQFQQTPLEDEYNAMQPTYVSTLLWNYHYGYPYSQIHACDPGTTYGCITNCSF